MSSELRERLADASFFEVVRRLQARRDSDMVPIGHRGPPSREAVRLRPALDLAFGPSDLADCAGDAATGPVELTTRFLGLYGTSSPLPACYTELLLYDDPEGRLRAFLDVFNHRLLSFVYRAWEKYRHVAAYDGSGDDPITRRLRLLCHLERGDDPRTLLDQAGLLHRRPMSEATLERILRQHVHERIEVASCRIRWIPVPAHQRSALGVANCALGGTAPLGCELRAATTTFGVVVGPLELADYLSFLPGGELRRRLEALLDRCNGDLLDCEITVAIEPAAIVPCRLGDGGDNPPARLGASTWLGADSPRLAGDLGTASTRSLHCATDPMVA